MNGEYSLHRFEERIRHAHGFEVCGDEARLPIVAMDDIRLPSKPFQGLNHTATKENEPFVVVFIVFLCRRTLVNTVPAIVICIV